MFYWDQKGQPLSDQPLSKPKPSDFIVWKASQWCVCGGGRLGDWKCASLKFFNKTCQCVTVHGPSVRVYKLLHYTSDYILPIESGYGIWSASYSYKSGQWSTRTSRIVFVLCFFSKSDMATFVTRHQDSKKPTAVQPWRKLQEMHQQAKAKGPGGMQAQDIFRFVLSCW